MPWHLILISIAGAIAGYALAKLERYHNEGKSLDRLRQMSIVRQVEIIEAGRSMSFSKFFKLPKKEQLRRRLQSIIDEAIISGYIITIEMKPTYNERGQLGRCVMVYDIRESRDRYSKNPPFDKE